MAYEYDHDCPFEAFITNLGKYNEGELVGRMGEVSHHIRRTAKSI